MKKRISPHVLVPLVILLVIAAMGGAWTVIMVSGDQPFSVRNIGVEGVDGVPRQAFAPGEIVGIRREVCSDTDIGVEFFPTLQTESGAMLALGHTASYLRKECRQTVYLFVIPVAMPPGRYTYQNLVKYQSNLIGRDEQLVYPPLELEVIDAW